MRFRFTFQIKFFDYLKKAVRGELDSHA